MKKFLRYFPLSLSTKDTRSLIITLAIYIVLPLVFWLISSLFSKVILLGALMSLVTILFAVYCLAGIVITVLKVTNVIKS